MTLNGTRMEELHRALLSAYPSPAALRQMLRYADVDLERITTEGNLTDVAFSVVEWFEAEGRVGDLERNAVKGRPQNPEIVAYAAKYLVGGAHDALSLIPQLLGSEAVRRSLAEFAVDFEEARNRLTELATYKAIHDMLHMLQVTYFNQIVQHADRFPDDEAARADLEEHAIGLQSLVDSLGEVVERHAFVGAVARAVDDLVEGREALETALREQSKPDLRRAIRRVGSVLAVQPTIVNSRMSAAAQSLRLGRLASAVSAVRASLAPTAAPDLADRLASGEAELRELAGCVNALIDDHDRWQCLDVEVRRIAATLDVRLDELKDEWPRLMGQTGELASDCSERWAADLVADATALEGAIAANSEPEIHRSFRKYRRRVTERFFRVDVNLKSLCDRLVAVGEPLNRTIEGLWR